MYESNLFNRKSFTEILYYLFLLSVVLPCGLLANKVTHVPEVNHYYILHSHLSRHADPQHVRDYNNI